MNPAMQSPGLPPPGEVVAGKYRIEGIVGAGGMGIVMSATDLSLGRPVAIKFLSPEKASKDGAISRFMREARASASLDNEHVVKVYEVATHTSGVPYIVMELLRGCDLAAHLASRGPLPIQEAADYLLHACEALAEAHARGIVHRDLKPQNLFLTHGPDGSPCVKVLDFGISKAADSAEVNLTSTDMVMGTPLYMSPEQVRSLKSVDHLTDIWSLGAILQELLTQRPAFDGVSASALCAAIAMDPPRPLRAARPDVPPELEGIVLRCLHKDPAGRFPDVASLGAAIAAFASDRGRQSASRLSHLARSGSGHAVVQAASLAPTMDVNARPSGMAPFPQGSYGPPPMMGVPTQGTWGHTTQNGLTRTGEAPRSSAALVILAGMLTGVLLLGVVGGVGYWMYTARNGEATQPTPVASATAKSKPVSAPAAARSEPDFEPGGSGPESGEPTPPASPAPPKPGIKPAPAPQPSPSPPPGPAPKPAPKDDIAARRRLAQSQCAHWEMQMRNNDPKNNDVAKRLKPMICLPAMGRDGAACARAMCARICTLENDQVCFMRLRAADRQFPPRF